jgi:hypothetical protein
MVTCGDADVEVAAAAGECYDASLEMWMRWSVRPEKTRGHQI